jgi:hypothetical protein
MVESEPPSDNIRRKSRELPTIERSSSDVAGSYMDAPRCQALFPFRLKQVEIAAIHSASVSGAWPRALMG